jgi:hypothetical protein
MVFTKVAFARPCGRRYHTPNDRPWFAAVDLGEATARLVTANAPMTRFLRFAAVACAALVTSDIPAAQGF